MNYTLRKTAKLQQVVFFEGYYLLQLFSANEIMLISGFILVNKFKYNKSNQTYNSKWEY